MLMHYHKSSCTVPQPAADSQCFSLHMYSIYVKHLHSLYSLYFLSLSLVVQGKHLYIVYLVKSVSRLVLRIGL